MSPSNLPQKIEELLSQSFVPLDAQIKVLVKRDSFGWLRLYVVTSAFEQKSLDERELQINTIITALNLNLNEYPFANYRLLTPLEEASEPIPLPPVQLPLWSEILMAPDPEVEFVEDEDSNGKSPFVVTFYSFKGGVGRSTALALVANILATRGHRVVMIDFDLEAPGLSFVHSVEAPGETVYGVLDYIYQRYLTPEENKPKIDACIRQINISTRGELYLIPAGEYDEGYIHRLADLSVHALYQSETNPLHQLLEDVKESLKPHIILIDARTGFTEMGAVALLDQADLGIICFSPTSQSFAGLEWVVKAVSKQRKYNGIPDLRFLLTPMPPVDLTQQQKWLSQAADWITDHWEVPLSSSVITNELYYPVPYNPNITTLGSLFTDVPTAILDPYIPVADVISASLPKEIPVDLTTPDIRISDYRSKMLKELRFRAPNAQEMRSEEIPTIFQRTGDFSKFLLDRTWLVRGAKGTGKTLLFRLFTEKSENARNLAIPYGNLHNVEFIPGHGSIKSGHTLLTNGSLEDYEQLVGSEKWKQFWLNYLLLQLVSSYDQLRFLPLDPSLIQIGTQKNLSQRQILEWLNQRLLSTLSFSQAYDELYMIDEWLQQNNKKIWILYDELDASIGQRYERRSALEALFSLWLEVGPNLNSISPKILLREDIWTSLNFTNKTYYSSRTVLLHWEEEDLWRLVLRQALATSPIFASIVQQQTTIELARLDSILQLDILRKGLFPLWGELMGRKNKAYTYNWVRKRIGDCKNNRFPRSLISLLQRAVELEEMRAYERNSYEVVLRPRSLIDAMPEISVERVNDVCNEYPLFAPYLGKLDGERSPIDSEHLAAIWGVDPIKLKELVTGMIAAGIFQEYPSRLQPPGSDIRYSVAELYLSGLKMTRKGQS